MKDLPEKYSHIEVEQRWGKAWESSKIYQWDKEAPREDTFVVDTPPPTVSGSLHVGHVFSYTQTDVIARYQRMKGKNIFYPMGWDDNGLPTERRVQNYFNIRCEPGVPYKAGWQPQKPAEGDKSPPEIISRQNFIEACALLTVEDEKAFEALWKNLGLSIDWTQTYATIDPHCRKISQLSFLDLIEKGHAYNVDAPTVWDVDFKSAVAQAEIEDREIPGAFHDLTFQVEGGETFTVATTRPELLPACIAVVAHPDDKRYQSFFGKTAITPLFHAPVPIMAAEHADPEKGSGILMVCTFGDNMDVEWWKSSKLPLKQIIGLDGRMLPVEYGSGSFVSKDPQKAKDAYGQLAGLTVKQAQKKIVELLGVTPKPIMHPVKFFEKGDRPLEFIPTRQWFIRTMQHKDALIEQGKKVQWHPSHMFHRYEHWVLGLNQDWCISRQRFFGVPFPVWYPISQSGLVEYDKPIYAKKEHLPVDPITDIPAGYTEAQRDKPGGFTADQDVMDTWATSSLTPQIASAWGLDTNRHKKLFPMDIRPQAHEIIRTWAFSTIVKAWMHEGEIPWKHAIISGWILDPDRKKMSKSKGNVIVPTKLLEEYSADAVRYWAAKARLGADTAFDEGIFKIGRKLTTKLFNASKFVLMQFDRIGASVTTYGVDAITVPLDKALIQRLKKVIEEATTSFERFDYAQALQLTEDAFWLYCDHYVELVKARTYEDQGSAGRDSGYATLAWSLKTFLRLFAPFLPYITEEIWSWGFATSGKDASVHTTAWPTTKEISVVKEDIPERSLEAAIDVLGQIRGSKTEHKRSLKWGVTKAVASGPKELHAALEAVKEDVLRAGNITAQGLTIQEAASPHGQLFTVAVTLAETPPE